MSESNLPPEQWRPYFDRAGIEFGYRPLATRAGLTHTRVHRLIRGGGTTDEAIQQVADALGVKASKVRELRGSPAVDVEPFTLPDDAGRLTHSERDVVRAVVRALLDARDRNAEQPADTPDPTPAQPRAQGAEDQKSSASSPRMLPVSYDGSPEIAGAQGAEDEKIGEVAPDMLPVSLGHDDATDVDGGTAPEGRAADDARPNAWRDKPDELRDRRSRRQAGRDFEADPIVEADAAALEGGPGEVERQAAEQDRDAETFDDTAEDEEP